MFVSYLNKDVKFTGDKITGIELRTGSQLEISSEE